MRERTRKRNIAALRRVLTSLGADLRDPDFIETPERILRDWEHVFSDSAAVERVKLSLFPCASEQYVHVGPIAFSGRCPHHLLPYAGDAFIGYLPAQHVLGLSKFSRVVVASSAYPRKQEDLTADVSELLYERLKPRALHVLITATHSCVSCRGVHDRSSKTTTTKVLGPDGFSTLAEFMATVTLCRP